MVEHQPSKLDTWVRFPSPALCMHFFILMPIYIQQVFMALPAHLFTLHHPKERKLSYET